MKLELNLGPVLDQIRAPAAQPADQAPGTGDPNAMASRLRIKREMLDSYRRDRDAAIEICRQNAVFRQIWDTVIELERDIPALEEELKGCARAEKRTLDFPGFAAVLFSNPVSKSVSYAKAIQAYPDLRQRCPEVLVEKIEVDLKAFEAAIAGGALPDEASKLIDEKPTTKAGRVELKYA